MIMQAIALLWFLSISFVDAFYRAQSANLKFISKSADESNVQSLREVDHFQKQVTQGSTCYTGCPGCNLDAGPTGTVMSAPVTLYHIYIGHSASDYAPGVKFRTILDSLATGLQNTPDSPYLNILSGYTDTHGNTASKQFTFGGAYVYTYPSTTLSSTVVADAIGAAISDATSGIKMNTTAIYTVFFRGDSNYCFTPYGKVECWASSGGWCGYHSSVVPTGQTQSVIFSTLGDTTYGNTTGCSGLIPPPTYLTDVSTFYLGLTTPLTNCFDSQTYKKCTFGQTVSCTYCGFTPPNGDVSSDSAVTVYMHELFESITDGLGGFYVRDGTAPCVGSENGDLCVLSYSGLSVGSSRGAYNLQLSDGNGGTLYFLTQDNFDYPTKSCSNGVLTNQVSPPSGAIGMAPSTSPIAVPTAPGGTGSSNSLPSGTIIGIIVAVVLGVALVATTVWCFKSPHRSRSKQSTNDSFPPSYNDDYSHSHSNGYSNRNNYSSVEVSPQEVVHVHNIDHRSEAFGVGQIPHENDSLY